jgi:CheY-like chemotaxis protein
MAIAPEPGRKMSLMADLEISEAEIAVSIPWHAGPATRAAEAATSGGEAGAGPRRILVVEDSQDAAESLKALLGLCGHAVDLAFTRPARVEAAGRLLPQVVLCDLGLPGMDGHAVAAVLRQQPHTAAARLIAISGYGQDEDRRRCEAAGFDAHLIKPVDFDALLSLLVLPVGQTLT